MKTWNWWSLRSNQESFRQAKVNWEKADSQAGGMLPWKTKRIHQSRWFSRNWGFLCMIVVFPATTPRSQKLKKKSPFSRTGSRIGLSWFGSRRDCWSKKWLTCFWIADKGFQITKNRFRLLKSLPKNRLERFCSVFRKVLGINLLSHGFSEGTSSERSSRWWSSCWLLQPLVPALWDWILCPFTQRTQWWASLSRCSMLGSE